MNKKNKYVVGVDGGGADTEVVLADQEGNILTYIKTGPSNPNKIGVEAAVFNIGEAVEKIIKHKPQNEIAFIYIALSGGLERDKAKRKKIKKHLLKKYPGLNFLKKRIKVAGDQLAAFRSGTEQKTGILVIAGAGSIVMGWHNKKEIIIGGWDYILGDQGSGFWIGRKALQAVCKELDGRGPKTKLTELFLKQLGVKNGDGLMEKIYQKDSIETVAWLAPLVDKAASEKDQIAKEILSEAGNELALSVKTAVKKLSLPRKKFPVVIVGGIFHSKIIYNFLKKEIKKIDPMAEIIRPKNSPVVGAVRLALEKV